MAEQTVRQVLYETRNHASKPYISNYPPQQQVNEGTKGSFLSMLLLRGVTQLKEKWTENNQPSKLRKLMSLFISRQGEHVAVAAGNQITILKKEDDYQEPCGIFKCSSFATFHVGTWSENHDILGVADNTNTLYFIKANGEVVKTILRRHMKVSSAIVGLIAENDSDTQKSCLCNFVAVMSDGSLHHIEINCEPNGSMSSMQASDNIFTLKHWFPGYIFCFDYHPGLSLVVIGGSTISSVTSSRNIGSCHLSLWHRNADTELEHLSTLQFDGLFLKPKGFQGHITYPKVLISPECGYVATLDIVGCLHIFKLDKECFSLSRLSWAETHGSLMITNSSDAGGDLLNSIVDFSWWCDNILTLVKTSGVVTMVDIHNGLEVHNDDPVYSMPILGRSWQMQGNLFLLESSSQERHDTSNNGETTDSLHLGWITEDKFSQLEISKLRWSLHSFSQRTIAEMYNLLISSKNYEAALAFADRHQLDKDEVLKSQWLNSSQGRNEINMYLSNIKDQEFALSECVDRVGLTEDAVRSLLAYGLCLTDQHQFSEVDDFDYGPMLDICMARLKLLQYRDRLETFLGINMGRFSVQEYSKFRVMPVNEAAVALAESGKIGALNLLFKRHPYSLAPFMLEVLAAIPETVPVQTYAQLLPGRSPSSGVALREEDWVECEKMICLINGLSQNHDISIQVRTEPMVKRLLGSFWPSIGELVNWYQERAEAIDSFSGQLDNCLSLLDFAIRKGISELQQFYEDISYLHQIIYSEDNDGETSFSMSLVKWKNLSDYDKFKFMLKGVNEAHVIGIMHHKAIPFMKKRFNDSSIIPEGNHLSTCANQKQESFLVRWMKEMASENKLDICLDVVEEGCKDFHVNNVYFKDEVEVVDCALQCIYSCTVTDRWSIMASILSKLPELQDRGTCVETLVRRLRSAEGHVEAGRLLAFYQVPKPLNFFLYAYSDVKGVKQTLRLILSKFIRRHPSWSDSEWANMWRDMQCLREKAFPFLDLEYMLIEFCRGLLKAGKFSLARNYLKGTSSVALASDKAESLVIQAAREYFFSASSLACPEIWKAKECLNLYPGGGNVKAEMDIIDALTVKLPSLGVTVLPVQFRQIKDPMEIVKMAITSQTGAYLHVDELIEVSKLLGLRSTDEISCVEEAIAREAAVAGDLQLAFDLCLVLVKKGHGLVWDLCAAIARGPALDNMDINSRKRLLGFALSHCDEESISELLLAWKDLDLQGQCKNLMISAGTSSPNFLIQSSSVVLLEEENIQDIGDLKLCFDSDNLEVNLNKIKNIVSDVAKALPVEARLDWEAVLAENGKLLSFAALQLPWLLELSRQSEHGKKINPGKQHGSVRTLAMLTILSWLARNGFAPRDNLIASLAKSIVEPPATKEEDIMGCSYLLNLVDALNGVEVIEEQLNIRKDYQEICSIMNVGMIYSALHNSGTASAGPAQRRELLKMWLKEKHAPPNSDGIEKTGKVQTTFWREWKTKLLERKRVADHSRALEKIIPGVEAERFLSGDFNYIERVVLSLIESVKLEKKHILKDILKLAETYSLNCTEVLLQYLSTILISNIWTNDHITAEISEFRGVIINCAVETIKTISMVVYPIIDGCNKNRLAYIYGLLSDSYLQLEDTPESFQMVCPDQTNMCSIGLAQYYNIIKQECLNVAFVKNLNFKNIAGLAGLNFECFSHEVYAHIDESSLEALANMVKVLLGIYADVPEGIISWQGVYKHYVLGSLGTLEARARTDESVRTSENLQVFESELEQSYEFCQKYIRILTHSDAMEIMKQYFTVIVHLNGSYESLPDNSAWQDCLIILLNFWMRLADDMKMLTCENPEDKKFSPECLLTLLKVFMALVMEDTISPSQGWGTLVSYVNYGLNGDSSFEIYVFCRAMVLSGCEFGAVAEVFSQALSECSTASSTDCTTYIQDLPCFYLAILEPVLQQLVGESHEHKNLYYLLSSLSNLEGDLKVLMSVRQAIWERMVKFSDDLQLPSSIRVYALELMQFVSGRNVKGFAAEIEAKIIPWEGWDELHSTSGKSETSIDQGLPDRKDSSRFTSTLVALKSSELAASISPGIEITHSDLQSVEKAVSCFLTLCRDASSDLHFDSLLAILEEWEGLFTSVKDRENTTEAPDALDDWNNDNWDEGWESLQEVDPLEKEVDESTVTIHPLHACWMDIFKKCVSISRFNDVLSLIDQSSSRYNGILLNEDDAKSLTQILIETDCFMSLKMALLLPYEALWLQSLGVVEDYLKQGIPEKITPDNELLIIVLSSGFTRTIISEPAYGTTFSFLCYLVGTMCRLCQEIQLSIFTRERVNDTKDNHELLLFRRILFPCFVSELVMADQQVLAGFLVAKYMHTNASLSLINIAEASLVRFLERELHALQGDNLVTDETCKTLKNTVCSLRGKLNKMIQSALLLLPPNVSY